MTAPSSLDRPRFSRVGSLLRSQDAGTPRTTWLSLAELLRTVAMAGTVEALAAEELEEGSAVEEEEEVRVADGEEDR